MSVDITGLEDYEILELIQEQFEEDARLDLNYIDIEVVDCSITISGRVSSEEELQVVDEILIDAMKLKHYENKVWVDETLAYEDPEDEGPDLKHLSFEDGDIDDDDYEDDDDDDIEF